MAKRDEQAFQRGFHIGADDCYGHRVIQQAEGRQRDMRGVSVTLPFTDVGSSIFFCQIAEAYFSGLTNGTSATTYSPTDPVPREQMAAFITRTQDSALRRGSKRAALRHFWTTTPNYASGSGGLGTNNVGSGPVFVESDGEDLWV